MPLDNFLTDSLPTENINEIFLDKYDFSKSQCYELFDKSTDRILVVNPNWVIKIRTTGYPNVIIWKCNDVMMQNLFMWNRGMVTRMLLITKIHHWMKNHWLISCVKTDNQDYLLEVEIAK
ncbi:hypothetical protein [Spiroplasma mirum]|uniref:hypothetical protein n=1 Tax=Spiroplasma mirum TaxID=2144 RepID=UPI000B078D25|nr:MULTISPECIES: hypothetical protein [Spiroplasma]